jgi:hypothetical protein
VTGMKNIEFENFDALMGKLLRVPHSEIKRELDREKEAKKEKRKPKKPSASGREGDAQG